MKALLRGHVPLGAKCHALGFLPINAVKWLAFTCDFGAFVRALPALLA